MQHGTKMQDHPGFDLGLLGLGLVGPGLGLVGGGLVNITVIY